MRQGADHRKVVLLLKTPLEGVFGPDGGGWSRGRLGRGRVAPGREGCWFLSSFAAHLDVALDHLVERHEAGRVSALLQHLVGDAVQMRVPLFAVLLQFHIPGDVLDAGRSEAFQLLLAFRRQRKLGHGLHRLQAERRALGIG